MDQTEIEILRRQLARANPPPILYRYRRPTEHTLEEIRQHRVFAAMPDDLNDPFEYNAPLSIDTAAFRKVFIEEFAASLGIPPQQAAKEFDEASERLPKMLRDGLSEIRNDTGIICLSAVPDSIRMWSYYAEAHKGVCIGYNTNVLPFWAAMRVTYKDPEESLGLAEVLQNDPSRLMHHVSLRKALEWEFEQEYRIPLGQIGDRPRALPYDPSALAVIRFGTRIGEEFRVKVMHAIADLPQRPQLIQMRCDFERFVLTEEAISD